VGQRATLENQIRGLAAVLENTIRRFQSPAVRKQRSLPKGAPNVSSRPEAGVPELYPARAECVRKLP
jgi:hypothetical protein